MPVKDGPIRGIDNKRPSAPRPVRRRRKVKPLQKVIVKPNRGPAIHEMIENLLEGE